MIVTKEISPARLLRFSGHHLVWLFVFVGSVAALYHFKWLTIDLPWLPISIIGTAVAFYVGFKNNQAYDRMWEARKIWGAIVNDSRTWGAMVSSFIGHPLAEKEIGEQEKIDIKQRLIYRHIAWLYAHRSQLLLPTSWEHISQGGMLQRFAVFYQNSFGIGLIKDEVPKTKINQYLNAEEYERLAGASNTATQLIHEQALDIARLRESGIINDFRHVELMEMLKCMYDNQGRNERIKKFPLPRQYANMSRYFIGFFVALLPFSMIPELMKTGDYGLLLAVPITMLIGFIYVMMEVVGDYSENPFQGMANDIPMLSICRTIEIDLKEMLQEKNVPAPIQAREGVLM